MAKYRGSLRAQSYTKMRWSRVGGFTSFAKVVYERCLMNFCFQWTDQDVRNFMAANPGVHPYILPKRNLKGQYVHCPNFNLMHCIEDREFNNLHRMVTIIYAEKQDTLQALRDVEFSIFSDRTLAEVIHPFKDYDEGDCQRVKVLSANLLAGSQGVGTTYSPKTTKENMAAIKVAYENNTLGFDSQVEVNFHVDMEWAHTWINKKEQDRKEI